jgi:hypothetical protein
MSEGIKFLGFIIIAPLLIVVVPPILFVWVLGNALFNSTDTEGND